ncbi:hypothetical protein BD414DRAFT_497264 [Trametes punicea]|nr:hypothetical protein BD414DRAFT_497264 [Trametes punicea]
MASASSSQRTLTPPHLPLHTSSKQITACGEHIATLGTQTGHFSMTAYNHWRMELNNYLQAHGGVHLLSWDVFTSGPAHQPMWTAIVYIRGIEYARVFGTSQNAVKEEAARQALAALMGDRRRR